MKHVVRKGEYLTKIAAQAGFSPDDVWNASGNEALRAERDPNVLAPGDLVELPDAPPDPADLTREDSNTFEAELAEVDVVIALQQGGERLGGEPYVVEGLVSEITGTSDGDGIVRFTVDVHVERVQLLLPKRGLRLEVRVGYLHPVTTLSGQRARVQNLGFHPAVYARLFEGLVHHGARVDPDDEEALQAGIGAFQKAKNLSVTGSADDATRVALLTAHGS